MGADGEGPELGVGFNVIRSLGKSNGPIRAKIARGDSPLSIAEDVALADR